MKIVTPHLLKFAITSIFLTIAFRASLTYGIENEQYGIAMISAVIYGALMFTAGWIFGKKDGEYLPIFDIGFRFHLTTYVIHNGISLLWMMLGFSSDKENFSIITNVAFYWGIFLVIHFIFYLIARKRTIDSLDEEDIFE
jgi:hypothetical protein